MLAGAQIRAIHSPAVALTQAWIRQCCRRGILALLHLIAMLNKF